MKRAFFAVLLLGMARLSPHEQQASTTAGASISGIVVRAGSNEPLAGAQAILTVVTPGAFIGVPSPIVSGSGNGLPSTDTAASTNANAAGTNRVAPVNTDRDGKFVFPNLEPGLYSLEIYRNEYARMAYGQRVAGGPAAGS